MLITKCVIKKLKHLKKLKIIYFDLSAILNFCQKALFQKSCIFSKKYRFFFKFLRREKYFRRHLGLSINFILFQLRH
jgi:hypothetical protein